MKQFFLKLAKSQPFWTAMAIAIATLSGASTLVPKSFPAPQPQNNDSEEKPTGAGTWVDNNLLIRIKSLEQRADDLEKAVSAHDD